MYIDIPVKPHVKKYLLKQYGSANFSLTETDVIGKYLIPMLEPKKKANLPLRYNKDNVVTVFLGGNKTFNYKIWLPMWKAQQFNTFVDRMIKEQFYIYLAGARSVTERVKIDEVIRKFESEYDLHDTSLSFATLKRMYYRSRDRSQV